MKNIFICLLFLFSGLYLIAQNHTQLLKKTCPGVYPEMQRSFNVDSVIQACLADISADTIRKYMLELQSFGTRYQLEPNHKSIAVFLQEKFMSFGYTDVVLDSFINISGYFYIDTTWQYNVVATRNGTTNSQTQYITGAHYDSFIWDLQTQATSPWVPGADDNASGTAATLEIARVLALHNVAVPSTLKFICFAAEEYMTDDPAQCGSGNYASKARLNNDDIGFYINMDMISNATTNDSTVIVYHYPQNDYVFNVMMDACDSFSTMTPYIIEGDMMGDSHKFWVNGFESTFLEEYDFSTNYHEQSDSVGNCNVYYCADVARLSCAALLMGACDIRPVTGLRVVTVNACHDALVSWSASRDSLVGFYRIDIGTVPGVTDSSVVTADSFYVFTGLTVGTQYYISVTAVSNSGIESGMVTDSIVPANCTFDEGILIVDGSNGGLIGAPSDQVVDQFYNDVLFGFQRQEYAADSAGMIDLNTLGRFSSVLWYINGYNSIVALLNSERPLMQYLSSGGNLFLTFFIPLYMLEGESTLGFEFFKNKSFARDFLKLESTDCNVNSVFTGAVPVLPGFDTLHCDTSKTPGNMKKVGVFNPTSDGQVLYLYDSPYDSTQMAETLKNKNVGVLYDGSDFKTLTLGFPLYYMTKDEVQSMLRYVFENIFGEVYTGIEENATASNLQCYPNPVKDVLYVKGAAIDHYTITDVSGRVVLSGIAADNSIQVNILKPGVYILRTGAAVLLFVKE